MSASGLWMTTSDTFQRLNQSSIQTHGQVSKMSYFDIWYFWKSYCCRLVVKDHMRTWSSEPVYFSRSRSQSCRTVLLGAGAGAGMLSRSRSQSQSLPKMSRLRIPGYRVFEGKDAPKRSLFGLTSPYMGIAPPTLDRSIFGSSPLSLPNWIVMPASPTNTANRKAKWKTGDADGFHKKNPLFWLSQWYRLPISLQNCYNMNILVGCS